MKSRPAPVMAAGSAAESTAWNIRARGFCQLGNLCRWRGDVGDVFKRSRAPLAAVKKALRLRIEMIVGQGIPGAKWRVVIADARDEVVVGVNSFRADQGLLLLVAPGHGGGQGADQEKPDAFAAFHLDACPKSTEHGGGNDS